MTINVHEVDNFLIGINYPAAKRKIIEKAGEAGAHEDVVQVLQELPDRVFKTNNEVKEVLSDIINRQLEIGPT